MRKTSVITAILLILGIVLTVRAQSPAVPEVTVAELESAGYTAVTELARNDSRFELPVHYFRVAETIPEEDTRKDCDDCGNIVAVYLAVVPSAPGWARRNSNPLRLVGGRVQARRYHEATGTVLIVTGPAMENVSSLSNLLLERIAQTP